MKKYIIAVLITLFLITIPNTKAITKPKVTDHEKVTIYLFWASWCPHCHDFIKYFNDVLNEYNDYFDIVTYLVSTNDGNNENNLLLLKKVNENFNIGKESYPMIVIGSNYYKAGFGSDGTKIIEEALKAYQDNNYTDLIARIEKEYKVNGKVTSFNEACSLIGIESKNKTAIIPNISYSEIVTKIYEYIITLMKKYYFIISSII